MVQMKLLQNRNRVADVENKLRLVGAKRGRGTLLLSRFSRVRLCATPWTIQPARLLRPWSLPGKRAGVGCHFLLHICYCI